MSKPHTALKRKSFSTAKPRPTFPVIQYMPESALSQLRKPVCLLDSWSSNSHWFVTLLASGIRSHLRRISLKCSFSSTKEAWCKMLLLSVNLMSALFKKSRLSNRDFSCLGDVLVGIPEVRQLAGGSVNIDLDVFQRPLWWFHFFC